MTGDRATEWCLARGFQVADGELPSARLSFQNGADNRLRIEVSAKDLRPVELAYSLLMAGVKDYEQQNFSGALLWLQDWDIRSETTERVGQELLKCLRGSNPLAGDLSGAPAQLFGGSELVTAQAALTLPILFQWDAYLVPESAGFAAFVSNDRYVDVRAATPGLAEQLVELFESGRWRPKQEVR